MFCIKYRTHLSIYNIYRTYFIYIYINIEFHWNKQKVIQGRKIRTVVAS